MMMGYEKRSIEKTAELLLLLAWFLEEERERDRRWPRFGNIIIQVLVV